MQRFWLDIKHICDHLLDASIKTMKYLNGVGGVMGLHMSPWIHSKNVGDLTPTLVDGLIINFPWEQATHDNSLD